MKTIIALFIAIALLSVWTGVNVQSIEDMQDSKRFAQEQGYDRLFLIKCFFNDNILCHDD
jgi:hypothetical protein